jgi:hypothetical protein
VDAVEFVLAVQKLEPLHVPSDMACVSHDLEVFHGSDKAFCVLLEISLVAERQRTLSLIENFQSEL